ncbi:MAG: hypothetical protein Q7S79_01635 [bacterium]|nr:hypothetical protein [bacterium]
MAAIELNGRFSMIDEDVARTRRKQSVLAAVFVCLLGAGGALKLIDTNWRDRIKNLPELPLDALIKTPKGHLGSHMRTLGYPVLVEQGDAAFSRFAANKQLVPGSRLYLIGSQKGDTEASVYAFERREVGRGSGKSIHIVLEENLPRQDGIWIAGAVRQYGAVTAIEVQLAYSTSPVAFLYETGQALAAILPSGK